MEDSCATKETAPPVVTYNEVVHEEEEEDGVVSNHGSRGGKRRRNMSVIEWLDARQRTGLDRSSWVARKSRCRQSSYTGPINAGVASAERLSSAIAWNRSRMRNMILAVGPGTPASVVWKARDDDDDDDDDERQRALASSSSEDDDDDDDEDDSSMDVEEMEHQVAVMGQAIAEMEDDEDDDDDENEVQQQGGGEEARREETTETKGNPSGKHGTSEAQKVESMLLEDVTQNSNADEDDNEQIINVDVAAGGGDPDGVDEVEEDDSDEGEEEEEEDEEEEEEIFVQSNARRRGRALRQEALRILRRRLQEFDESHESGETITTRRQSVVYSRSWQPSMRHGGCINTACWLDCPWRLSTVNEAAGRIHPYYSSSGTPNTQFSAINSLECPTQILTSGDDRLVKFWDVSNSMGSASPIPGGWDTLSPFGSTITPSIECRTDWHDYYHNKSCKVAGSVYQLAALSTGHRGNVFHVTPMHSQQGKVLTCGADGFLRLCDMQADTSSVVVHPYLAEDPVNQPMFVIHAGMAFSHVMLNDNTGLLCSELGLHRFDIRVSPREQQRRSLLESLLKNNDSWRSSSCKSCAIWSPHSNFKLGPGEVESTYVFAGGSSEYVGLYDLRMDGSKGKVLQRYKPRFLEELGNVSVSGLDVSRDGKELLVSYESDQIYSFPIFPEALSQAGPTWEEISRISEDYTDASDHYIPEFASYGGHLNRFTFLKNAKYAGPRDEYICTGSDSGHAWIFERSSGTVAAFLGADTCTCNGVIPHPSLPYFISYGIDSTAKLWRATTPVDIKSMDDSPKGRVNSWKSGCQPYDMSPVARSWDSVQKILDPFDEAPAAMPDFIATSEEIASSGRFSSPCRRGMNGYDSPGVGNALRILPQILRQNRFECFRAIHRQYDTPIDHPIDFFNHRVSIIRLRHQADRLGVKWNPCAPWAFECPPDLKDKIHPADLVPDSPSDWILLDREMGYDDEESLIPWSQFNSPKYKDRLTWNFGDDPSFGLASQETTNCNHTPWLNKSTVAAREHHDDDDIMARWPVPEGMALTAAQKKSRRLFFDTVALLKDGGNKAMKEGHFQVAAHRYDKAIQYCAVVFMEYYAGQTGLKHLATGHHYVHPSEEEKPRSGLHVVVVWSPLLRILITTRLNMAMLFLKPEFSMARRSAEHARAAITLLYPFVQAKGKVVARINKKDVTVSEKEPEDTYMEATAIQAKACFRLGSAELEMGDYGSAVESFEDSLKFSLLSSPNEGAFKPDALLVRRLAESKRKHKMKQKRTQKKVKRALSGETPSTSASTPSSEN